jgi:steroid 5-alpha reductase family enzyme
MPLIGTLIVTAAITVLGVIVTFGIAGRRERYDTIDTFWGVGFVIVAVFAFALGDGALAPKLTALLLTVVWGARLAVHLHLRNRDRPEDPRYAKMAERAVGDPGTYLFVRVYLTQAGVLWFVSMPVQAAMYADSFGVTAWLGLAVWLVGFTFETAGDEQLRRFRSDPDNDRKVLDTGLWRYTRHPNYFGDACVWWGLYLVACSGWAGVATILSPAAMTYLLVKGTGKPLLEKGLRNSRPGYAEYTERTSGFFPLPPRRAATPP